jgi:hypothetical protein
VEKLFQPGTRHHSAHKIYQMMANISGRRDIQSDAARSDLIPQLRRYCIFSNASVGQIHMNESLPFRISIGKQILLEWSIFIEELKALDYKGRMIS